MLSFLAGMNQKDCFAFHTVVHTPAVCNDRCLGVDGAENCGSSTVAVHSQGRRLPCRAAEAHPHDQAVQQTIVIPLLPYTRWSMSLFTGRADFLRGAEAYSHGQTLCRTIEISQLLFKVVDALVMQVVLFFSFSGGGGSCRDPTVAAR